MVPKRHGISWWIKPFPLSQTASCYVSSGLSRNSIKLILGDSILGESMSFTKREQEVLGRIDSCEDEIVSFMRKLIQIPSFTGDEAEIGKFLFDEMSELGLDDVRIVEQMVGRPNVVARYRGETGRPSLTCYAHFDTVPLGDLTQWNYGPFSGEIVQNRIYGRGSCDHKFPIPPFLFAFKAIVDSGIRLNGDIVFAFVCDEEFGGHRGMRYLVDEGFCDTDYLLYGSVGGDGKTIGIAANGRAFYRINVKGKTMHTGRNEMGVNAAVKAAELILRLEELREEVNNRTLSFKAGDLELEGRGRFSINLLHAFMTGNNVPDRCIIEIDRRLIPRRESYDDAEAEIQSVIDELKREDPEFDAWVSWNPERWMNPSISVPDSPLVESLQRSVDKVLGYTPPIGKGPFGHSSDHGWFNLRYPDRPFASYAVGRGGNSHTYDEYITIDGLLDTTKIYALSMMGLLGTS